MQRMTTDTVQIHCSQSGMDVPIIMKLLVYLNLLVSLHTDPEPSFQVGNLCYRISPYPETYANAKARCDAEGSSLAYIPSETIQLELGAIIQTKTAMYDYFVGIEYFWLGAYTYPALDDWEWESYEKPVSSYNNWKAKKSGNSYLS